MSADPHLSNLSGTIVHDEVVPARAPWLHHIKAGETLRYRCDRRHVVRCVGSEPGTALMVCILKAAVME